MVAQDLATAARLYRAAAEGGDFRGMFNHARMLGPGQEALGWLKRAGAAGNARFVEKAAAWLLASPFGAEGAAAVREGAGC